MDLNTPEQLYQYTQKSCFSLIQSWLGLKHELAPTCERVAMRRPLNNPVQRFVDFICHWKDKEMKQIFLLLTIWLILFSCKKEAPGIDSSWPCDILADSSKHLTSLSGPGNGLNEN